MKDEDHAEDNPQPKPIPTSESPGPIADDSLACIQELGAAPVEPPEHPILGRLGDLPHSHYALLHQRLHLEPEDRALLKKKRGFSDALIGACQFKSCGPYVEQVLRQTFAMTHDDDLVKLGLLYSDTRAVCTQLTKPNILIPYFHEGNIVSLRPHKFGFKDLPVLAYIPPTTLPLLGKGLPLILAESEFKAAAATAFGFPAVGVPGISVMVGKHLPRLVAAVRALGDIQEIVVMFDSEEKLDPDLKNYKPDPRKAWDTQYRAMQHAELLKEQLHINARIATLPPEWRVDGKIDIDGALAQGRTQAEFQDVVAQAVVPAVFMDRLPKVGQKVVSYLQLRGTTGTRKRFENCSPRRRAGRAPRYEASRTIGRGEKATEVWAPVSNFTIAFHGHRQEEPGHPIRYLAELRSSGGKSLVEWKAQFQQNHAFKTFVTENLAGAYWSGKQEDLDVVLPREMNGQLGLDIYEPVLAGYFAANDLYIFGNCAIKEGKVYLRAGATPPGKVEEKRREQEERKRRREEMLAKGQEMTEDDEEDEDGLLDKVVFVNESGYEIKPLAVGSTGHKSPLIPILEPDLTRSLSFTEVIDTAQVAFPNLEDGVVLIFCTVLAGLIQHQFRGQVPVLYFWGLRETGKTTLALVLRSLAGFDFNAEYDSAKRASEASRNRGLSYFSNLPYYADDARFDDEQGRGLVTAIRSASDRSSASRAAGPGSSQTKSNPVRASFILSAEDVPGDGSAATVGRMIMFEFKKVASDTQRAHLLKLEEWARGASAGTPPAMSTIGRDFLRQVTSDNWAAADKITGEIQARWHDVLTKAGASPRVAHIYSGPAAVAEHMLGANSPRLEKFKAWLLDHIPEIAQQVIDEDASSKFYADLDLLDVFKLREVLTVDFVNSERFIVLALNKAAQHVVELRVRRGKGENVFSTTKLRNEVLKSLQSETGIKDLNTEHQNNRKRRLEDRERKNYRSARVPFDKAPLALQELANAHYDDLGNPRPLHPARQARINERQAKVQEQIDDSLLELTEALAKAVKSKAELAAPATHSAATPAKLSFEEENEQF